MPDDKVRVQISTEFDGQGSKEAVAATKSLANETAKATDKTNKWNLSKKALATNLARLTKEFPLLGSAGRLALNPILIAAAAAAAAFKAVSDKVAELDRQLTELQKTEGAFHDSVVEANLALKRSAEKELNDYLKMVRDTAQAVPTVTEKLDAHIKKLDGEKTAAIAAAEAQKELAKVRIETSGMGEPEKALALGKLEAKSKAEIQALEEEYAEKRMQALQDSIKASEEEIKGAKDRIEAANKIRTEQQSLIEEQKLRVEKLKAQESRDIDPMGFWDRMGARVGFLTAGAEKFSSQTLAKEQAEKELPAQQKLLTQRMVESERAADAVSKESAKIEELKALKKRAQDEALEEENAKKKRDSVFRSEADAERIRRAQQQADVLLEPGPKPAWVLLFEEEQKKRGLNEKQMEAFLVKILSERQSFAESLVARDAELEKQKAAIDAMNQRFRYISNIGGPS